MALQSSHSLGQPRVNLGAMWMWARSASTYPFPSHCLCFPGAVTKWVVYEYTVMWLTEYDSQGSVLGDIGFYGKRWECFIVQNKFKSASLPFFSQADLISILRIRFASVLSIFLNHYPCSFLDHDKPMACWRRYRYPCCSKYAYSSLGSLQCIHKFW